MPGNDSAFASWASPKAPTVPEAPLLVATPAAQPGAMKKKAKKAKEKEAAPKAKGPGA